MVALRMTAATVVAMVTTVDLMIVGRMEAVLAATIDTEEATRYLQLSSCVCHLWVKRGAQE